VYCSDRGLRDRQWVGATLSKERLYTLFKSLKDGGTRGITIEGGGEPTIHPDFDEIVEYARNLGLACGLITNGTRDIKPEVLHQFEWIRVSLDASTRDEFKKLKGRDCFEEVMSHILSYAKYCPTVGVGYVVTRENMGALESLVYRLREGGVSYIQMRPVVDSPELYPEDSDLSYLTYYQTAGFSVIVDGMVENSGKGNFELPCLCHSLTTVITGAGDVYLCGRLNIYEKFKPIGNILNNDFEEIWNGAERQRQSKLVQDSEFCKKYCPQCRVSKFNKKIYELRAIKSKDFI
jgi:radical SAM protein with 4Fe4S-binding SPASM domain